MNTSLALLLVFVAATSASPTYWSLMQSNVCFKTKNNGFGVITAPADGLLSGLRLVHKSGGVKCSPRYTYSKFGCNGIQFYTSLKVSVFITDEKNTVIYPQGETNSRGGFYTLPLHHANSAALTFFNAAPVYVEKGKKMKVWYGEDLLKSGAEQDNSGVSCVDVYAKYEY